MLLVVYYRANFVVVLFNYKQLTYYLYYGSL